MIEDLWKKGTKEGDEKFLVWIQVNGNLDKFRNEINKKARKMIKLVKQDGGEK